MVGSWAWIFVEQKTRQRRKETIFMAALRRILSGSAKLLATRPTKKPGLCESEKPSYHVEATVHAARSVPLTRASTQRMFFTLACFLTRLHAKKDPMSVLSNETERMRWSFAHGRILLPFCCCIPRAIPSVAERELTMVRSNPPGLFSFQSWSTSKFNWKILMNPPPCRTKPNPKSMHPHQHWQ